MWRLGWQFILKWSSQLPVVILLSLTWLCGVIHWANVRNAQLTLHGQATEAWKWPTRQEQELCWGLFSSHLMFASALSFHTLINQSKGIYRMTTKGTRNWGYLECLNSGFSYSYGLFLSYWKSSTLPCPFRFVESACSLGIGKLSHSSWFSNCWSIPTFQDAGMNNGLNVGILKHSSVLLHPSSTEVWPWRISTHSKLFLVQDYR